MEMSSKGIILAVSAINDGDDDTNDRRSIDRVSDLFAINVITNYGIVDNVDRRVVALVMYRQLPRRHKEEMADPSQSEGRIDLFGQCRIVAQIKFPWELMENT